MDEFCEICPLYNCPHMKKKEAFLGDEIINSIQKNTVPVCFHCGLPYQRDEKHCGEHHTTWRPSCNCVNKPTIRIVTGGVKDEETQDYNQ